MKIKKKIKKKSGSKTEILRNLEAQPKRLVSYKKKKSVSRILNSVKVLQAKQIITSAKLASNVNSGRYLVIALQVLCRKMEYLS